jgi:hypothetical protein
MLLHFLLTMFSQPGSGPAPARLRIGAVTPTALRKGTSVIARVYFGTTQVWPAAAGSGFDSGFDSGFGA